MSILLKSPVIWFRFLSFFVFGAILFRYLFLAPIHGFSDNYDFWRVMHPAGIEYLEESRHTYTQYVQRIFSLSSPRLSVATTSAVLPPMVLGKLASLIGNLFDLRILSFFYSLVFLSGIYSLTAVGFSPVFLVGVCWACLNPELFLHFNSFFSLAPLISFFPWLLYFIQRESNEKRNGNPSSYKKATKWGALALFLATTKPQFALLPFLILASLKVPQYFADRKWKIENVDKILFLAGAGSILWNFVFIPHPYNGIAYMQKYQAIFTGIGTVAQDPNHALSSLGIAPVNFKWNSVSLPKELLSNQLSPTLREQIEALSRARLAWLYLSEPGALRNSFEKIFDPLARPFSGVMGNFEWQPGAPPSQKLQLSWQHSRVKETILDFAPWLLWCIVALEAFVFWFFLQRKSLPSKHNSLLLFLLLYFTSQIPLCVLGDGFAALERHFITVRFAWDLAFWLTIEILAREMIPLYFAKHSLKGKGLIAMKQE